jgi:hypothetical protein
MTRAQSFVAGMCSTAFLLVFAFGASSYLTAATPASPQGAAQGKWPPQFPRDGATKIFENDKFIIWDTIYKQGVFMHKHIRDTISITLVPAKIEVTQGPGSVNTVTDTNRAMGGGVPQVAFAKAGHGPHSEHLLPPDTSGGRKLYIEFKGTEPQGCSAWSTAC